MMDGQMGVQPNRWKKVTDVGDPPKKSGKKLSVLVRLSVFMSIKQRSLLMKSFVEWQFGYCNLIWIYNKMNTWVNDNKNLSNSIMNSILQSRTMTYNSGHSQFLWGVLSALVVLAWIHFIICDMKLF